MATPSIHSLISLFSQTDKGPAPDRPCESIEQLVTNTLASHLHPPALLSSLWNIVNGNPSTQSPLSLAATLLEMSQDSILPSAVLVAASSAYSASMENLILFPSLATSSLPIAWPPFGSLWSSAHEARSWLGIILLSLTKCPNGPKWTPDTSWWRLAWRDAMIAQDKLLACPPLEHGPHRNVLLGLTALSTDRPQEAQHCMALALTELSQLGVSTPLAPEVAASLVPLNRLGPAVVDHAVTSSPLTYWIKDDGLVFCPKNNHSLGLQAVSGFVSASEQLGQLGDAMAASQASALLMPCTLTRIVSEAKKNGLKCDHWFSVVVGAPQIEAVLSLHDYGFPLDLGPGPSAEDVGPLVSPNASDSVSPIKAALFRHRALCSTLPSFTPSAALARLWNLHSGSSPQPPSGPMGIYRTVYRSSGNERRRKTSTIEEAGHEDKDTSDEEVVIPFAKKAKVTAMYDTARALGTGATTDSSHQEHNRKEQSAMTPPVTPSLSIGGKERGGWLGDSAFTDPPAWLIEASAIRGDLQQHQSLKRPSLISPPISLSDMVEEEEVVEGGEVEGGLVQFDSIGRRKPNKGERRLTQRVIDRTGKPKLPLRIGNTVIHALGKIDPTRATFHSHRHIFPIGFRSSRQYDSIANPGEKTEWISEIIEDTWGDSPLFSVTATDDPSNSITKDSATAAWAHIMEKTNASRPAMEERKKVSGMDFFGLSRPEVSFLIQRMPGAKECVRYQMQTFVGPGADQRN